MVNVFDGSKIVRVNFLLQWGSQQQEKETRIRIVTQKSAFSYTILDTTVLRKKRVSSWFSSSILAE